MASAYRFDGNRLSTSAVAKGSVGSRGSPGGALTVNRSADHGNAAGVLRTANSSQSGIDWAGW
jgi:hypothetical protein